LSVVMVSIRLSQRTFERGAVVNVGLLRAVLSW